MIKEIYKMLIIKLVGYVSVCWKLFLALMDAGNSLAQNIIKTIQNLIKMIAWPHLDGGTLAPKS